MTLVHTDRAPAESPLAVLQGIYGYDHFRGDQAAIINTLVAGDDALVLMPTGGGKSLCYQIPSLVRPGFGEARLVCDRRSPLRITVGS